MSIPWVPATALTVTIAMMVAVAYCLNRVRSFPVAASSVDRLEVLENLHKRGLITDDEWRSKREEILKDL